jgi:hypothetical protein
VQARPGGTWQAVALRSCTMRLTTWSGKWGRGSLGLQGSKGLTR